MFNYTIDNTWISAGKTRNYLLNDPLIDYLKLNQNTNTNLNFKKRKSSNEDFHNIILDNGHIFEQQIIDKLHELYPGQISTIINPNQSNLSIITNPAYFKITIDKINERMPIIYQGVLHNPIDKTYGVPDLIVRGDYITKIFQTTLDIISPDLYYIIDIKNSNIQLSSSSDQILNNLNIKPYKSQILIYHRILSQIQKTDTNLAFILASRFTRKKNNKIYRYANPFDRLGIINYAKTDISYNNLTDSAIVHNKNLKTLNTTQFDNNFLYTNRIYPNMSNHTEPKYKKQKLEIATNNYEITSIWMCGIKQRNNALKYNIDKWSDKRLTSKILGIKGNRGRIVDLILKINRSENIIIYPKKIKNNIGNWQNRTNLAFYIDFETLNKTAFEPSIWTNIIHDNYQSSNDIIFMIGIGYSINNQFKYKTLYLNDLSTNQQVLIIEQFIQFIKDISSDNNINYQDVNLYHWSNFEPMILSKLCTKLNIIFPVFKWIDILKIFHTEPIIIKGALNFSLKTIGHSMYKLGLIKTIWKSSNISDGLSAMYNAYKIYLNLPNNKLLDKQMKNIVEYNKIDCKIMWDILNALYTINTI